MKCLIVLMFCFVFFATAAFDEQMKKDLAAFMTEVAMECAKAEGASPEELASLIAKNLPTTRHGHCLVACIQEKTHMQSSDGKMSLGGALETITFFKGAPEIYQGLVHIVNECIPKTYSESDRCEVAAIFATCAHGKAVQLGILDWV